jgi:hypothetical protein
LFELQCYVGFELAHQVTSGKGVQILDVKRGDRRTGSPGFAAHLNPQVDYVVCVLGRETRSDDQFGEQLRNLTPGDAVPIVVYSDRSGERRDVTLVIGSVGMNSDEVFALRRKCKIDEATTPIFERPKPWERLTDFYLCNSQCWQQLPEVMQLESEITNLKRALALDRQADPNEAPASASNEVHQDSAPTPKGAWKGATAVAVEVGPHGKKGMLQKQSNWKKVWKSV